MNILRATYNPLEPQACGVQDKGSTHQAIKQDGRAPQRDNTLLRLRKQGGDQARKQHDLSAVR